MSKCNRTEMRILSLVKLLWKFLSFLTILCKEEHFSACSIFIGDCVRCIITILINVHAMRVIQRENRWN